MKCVLGALVLGTGANGLFLAPDADKMVDKLQALEKLPLPAYLHAELVAVENEFETHKSTAKADLEEFETELTKLQKRLGLCKRLLAHLGDGIPEELHTMLEDPSCPNSAIRAAEKFLVKRTHDLEAKQTKLEQEIADGKLNMLANLLRRRENLPLFSQKAVCKRDMFKGVPECEKLMKVEQGSLYKTLIAMPGVKNAIVAVPLIAQTKNTNHIVSSRMVNILRDMMAMAEDTVKKLKKQKGAEVYIRRIDNTLTEVRAHPHNVQKNLDSLEELMKSLM